MELHRRNVYIAVCALAFLFPLRSYGKTVAGLVKQGNSAYNGGDYDAAVTAYDNATTEDPDSPYAYFNKGAALYQKGDYAGAKEAFEAAALKGRDNRFEAKTRFNLGNTAYKEAEALKATDLQKALEGCSNSVTYYQEALKLDPEMKEAAENMEMVRLVMKNILDEIQKQKEADEKDQEKKDQAAEQLKEIIKEQESALEKNRQLQKEQAEKGVSSGLNKKIQELADEQKTIRDKTVALSKEWPEQEGQEDDSGVSSSKHLENAVKDQDAAYGNMGERNIKEAEKNQEDAVEELKEALGSQQEDNNSGAGQNNENEQDKQQEQQASSSDESQKDEGDQTQEQVSAAEVSDDAQDILKDEKENKEQRRALEIRSYKGVDKDW